MKKHKKTIVIVTHGSKVARCCGRVIELRDGLPYAAHPEVIKQKLTS